MRHRDGHVSGGRDARARGRLTASPAYRRALDLDFREVDFRTARAPHHVATRDRVQPVPELCTG